MLAQSDPTIRFPEREDIRLLRSPLTELIRQVCFPALLRITHALPVEFQETLPGQFPNLEIEQSLFVEMCESSGESPSSTLKPRNYRFKSADGCPFVILALDF